MLRPALALVLAAFTASAARGETVLDYDFFKRKVEPIFLKKRGDHARCAVCHQLSNNAFRLEKLPDGASLQPLAPQAGGNAYHSGGWQFASKNDPDWKTLAAWVNGRKK